MILQLLHWAARPRVFRVLTALGCGLLVTSICLWMAVAQMGIRYESDVFLIRKYAQLAVRCANAFRTAHHRLPKDTQELLADGSVEAMYVFRYYNLEAADRTIHAVYSRSDGPLGLLGSSCAVRDDTSDLSACRPGPEVLWRDPRSTNMVMVALLSGFLSALLAFLSIRPCELNRDSCLASAVGFGFLVAAAGFVAATITALHYPSGH